jgi:dephospho-CoA kinase
MKVDDRDITVIGITGTIGSGKSTLGNILLQRGVPVIDTDKIVHELLASDDEVKMLIKEHFPSAIEIKGSGPDITISRKKLAGIIFQDAGAKKQLELILHPRVRQVCQQQIREKANLPNKARLVAVLVPLLFESKLQSMYDTTWTVIADEKILRQRLSKRDGLSEEEIDMRLAGQMTQEQKAKLADEVLDNSGDENELADKVSRLIEGLRSTYEQKSC